MRTLVKDRGTYWNLDQLQWLSSCKKFVIGGNLAPKQQFKDDWRQRIFAQFGVPSRPPFYIEVVTYLPSEDVGGGGVEAHALLSLSPKKGRWHLFPSLTSSPLLPLSQTGERPRFSPKVTFPASPPSTHTVRHALSNEMGGEMKCSTRGTVGTSYK